MPDNTPAAPAWPAALIEAMARAARKDWCVICDAEDLVLPWEDADAEERDSYLSEAAAALTALCASRPDIAAILRGEAVAVPRALLGSLCDDVEAMLLEHYGSPPHSALRRKYVRDAADVAEARRLLAASPYAREGGA